MSRKPKAAPPTPLATDCADPAESELIAQFETLVEQDGLEERFRKEQEIAERRRDIAELKRLLKAEERVRRYRQTLAEYLPLVHTPTIEAKPRLPRKAPRNTWSLVLSDWHFGQRTEERATGYLFEQTSEIASRQVAKLWERLDHLFAIESQSVKLEKLVLFIIGDLVEGDAMRKKQAWQVDAVVAVQCMQVVDELAALLAKLLTRFEVVEIEACGGNHDRTSEKPGEAGLGELDYVDTWAWIIIEALRRMFADAIAAGRLVVNNAESFFGATVVDGSRIVYEHGSSFKASVGSYGGIGFYGIVNAARGYVEMLAGADIILMGHWHTSMILPLPSGEGWIIMNGSLPPSTQYVQAGMKRYRRPVQTLFTLAEGRGLINWQPLYLDLPDVHHKPGDYWARLLAEAAA